MNTLLSETKQLFSGLDAAWAVCGGFALDLFLGRETRPHGDIDLCAFEEGRGTIQAYMHGLGWRVYEFRGMGRVRLLTPDTPGEAGRNLMCVRDGCELVDFYPSDVEGLLWHVFHHVGIHKLNYLEFLSMGCSKDPLEELQHAGVDLSTAAPIDAALDKFASVLDEAEKIAEKL